MGAILYEMVTGHVPFEGNTPMSVALKRMTETPLEPRKLNAHINEDLNRVIMRCMVKERAKRYQTTQELHAALSDIARSLPKTDRETAALKPLGSRGITVTFKPKRILLPLVAIGLVVAAGLMVRHFLLKSAEPDLPFPPAQAIQEAAPPETKEKMEPPPAENPPEDKPAAVIPQTQIIPEKTEAPPVRPAVREREEAAQTAEKIGGILREAGRAFQEKRYPECLDLVREALALDPDNAEAMLLASRAERQISSQQILALVDGFIQAMNSGSLPEFYGEACSPELFMRIEDDAEFIVKQYVSFRSVASDVEISFEANDRAEASFSNITTGVRKQGTTPQVIFEGIYTWELERTGRGWRIAKLVFRPIERQQ
jgi:hypothetical protein